MDIEARLKLKEMIKDVKNAVFFGGAGVSVASGIPDFRGGGGLYTSAVGEYSPEEILSHGFLMNRPEAFFEYYKKNMLYPDAVPNAAHRALSELEARGILGAVITQNIDGLHQRAGSERVIELHGSVLKNYCMRCGKKYDLDAVSGAYGVPRCEACGGIIRPDVVLYGEGLDGEAIEEAAQRIYEADMLIVGGTSLTVNPAASLVGYYEGGKMVIINKSPTPYDGYADLIIREPIEEVLGWLIEEIDG